MWFECQVDASNSWFFAPPGDEDAAHRELDGCEHKSACDADRETSFWGRAGSSFALCHRDSKDHSWSWGAPYGGGHEDARAEGLDWVPTTRPELSPARPSWAPPSHAAPRSPAASHSPAPSWARWNMPAPAAGWVPAP